MDPIICLLWRNQSTQYGISVKDVLARRFVLWTYRLTGRGRLLENQIIKRSSALGRLAMQVFGSTQRDGSLLRRLVVEQTPGMLA